MERTYFTMKMPRKYFAQDKVSLSFTDRLFLLIINDCTETWQISMNDPAYYCKPGVDVWDLTVTDHRFRC
ncbi:hypothetical protein KP509_20G002900 [Ceratopteris richardii]|uniref:Uncharacterized protein n=1 Tax=Ceratopteris richardii TaxID=49495 RepID=A0A8T2SEC5_CERRI|nr:hypothetical protein KP509_20G002900 [Ceratopteris richardii]